MIRIVVNGKDLDLGDIQITMNFQNPLFTDSVFDEGFSYSFKIDDTPRNRSVLSHVERIDSRAKTKRYRGSKLYFKGIKVFNCTLITGKTTNNQIPCNIINDGLDTAKELAAFNIRDLEYEDIEVWDPADARVDKQIKIGTRLADQLTETLLDPASVDHYFPPIYSRFAWDFDKAESVGFTSGFTENHWWGHYFNQHIGIDYLTSTGVHKNLWENSGKEGFTTSLTATPRVIPVIEKILEHFGLNLLDSELLELEEIKRMFVFAAISKTLIEKEGIYYWNLYMEKYNVGEFLPDVNGLEFVKIFKDIYRAVLIKNADSIEYLTPKEILESIPEDMTRFTNPDYVNEVLDRNRYILSWQDDSEDSYFENGPEFTEVIIQPEEYESDVEISPFTRPMRTFLETSEPLYPDSAGLIKPAGSPGFAGTLNIVAYNSQVQDGYSANQPKDVMKRIMLGIWRDPLIIGPVTLLRTSNIIETNNPPDVVGEHSILWDNEEGLVNQHWKILIDFVNGAMNIEKMLHLPIHKVIELMSFRKPKHTFYTDKGLRTGILESFSVTLTNKGITPVKAKYLSKIIYD